MLDNNDRIGRSKEKASIKQSDWNRPTVRPDNQIGSLLGENKEKIFKRKNAFNSIIKH